MSKALDEAKRRFFDDLVKKAENVMDEIELGVGYQNQTYNLYDSYGYCIYLYKKKYKVGYRSNTQKAKVKNRYHGKWYSGREEINKFFDRYTPKNNIEIVFAVSMPYGVHVENLGYNVFENVRLSSKAMAEGLNARFEYLPFGKA